MNPEEQFAQAGPPPEHDLGDEDFFEEMEAEPGMPDEMVAEYMEEPVDIVGFNFELLAENSPIVMMAFAAIAVTETVKALGLRKWVRDKQYDEEKKSVVYRWVLFFAAVVASQTLGFRALVYDVTGSELDLLESGVWGGIVVGAIAALIYSMKLVKMFKKYIYSKFGTTPEEMEAPTVRGMAPVNPDKLPKPEASDE